MFVVKRSPRLRVRPLAYLAFSGNTSADFRNTGICIIDYANHSTMRRRLLAVAFHHGPSHITDARPSSYLKLGVSSVSAVRLEKSVQNCSLGISPHPRIST